MFMDYNYKCSNIENTTNNMKKNVEFYIMVRYCIKIIDNIYKILVRSNLKKQKQIKISPYTVALSVILSQLTY